MAAMGPNGPQFTNTRNNGPPRRPGSTPNAGATPQDMLDPIPDLGIMKGLQDMGVGMKRQLSVLAAKFKAHGGGNTTPSRMGGSGGVMDPREHQPLVQHDPLYEV